MFAKLVTAAVSPLGTSLLLGLLGLAILAWSESGRWRRRGLAASLVALAWLWLWSTPLASDALRGALEDKAGPRRAEAVARGDAIVVLGGGMKAARPPSRPYPDLGAAADRAWHAARLYRAQKAPQLLLSGGTRHPGEASEAQAMRQFLLELGVPPGAMLLEDESVTTRENAARAARVLRAGNVQTVILVTSALHMRRAVRLFEQAGFRVVPAPTDFEVVDRPFGVLRVLPDADALEGSGRAIKELVGFLAGR